MKLQISFDIPAVDQAIAIAKDVEPFCDQFEIGSLMLYAAGAAALTAFRKQFPSKPLVADAKIIDRSAEIIEVLAHAGANWITIMGGTNKHVLYTAAHAAQQHNIKLMLDLIDASSPGQVAMDAQALGTQSIILHKPHDETDSLTFLDQWDLVRGNTKLPLFIAASITRESIAHILSFKPDGIIIGHAITMAKQPAQEAEYFYKLCKA
jgi:3-hexulose-6-phosphate synthase